ncbi:MAG: SseB family protein [Actinobacteria bacterium]|nr:SseB family protein [Actinomycetota bacterium]
MDEPRTQRSLTDVAAGVAAGAASAHALHRAFLHATLWCEAPESPGFVARGQPPEAVVAVYSSPEQLAADRGPQRWFSTTGADLLDLLPAGHDLVLDPAGTNSLRLRPSALERITVVEVTKGGPR